MSNARKTLTLAFPGFDMVNEVLCLGECVQTIVVLGRVG